MKPGDLVRAKLDFHFFTTPSRVNNQRPDEFIGHDELLHKGTTGIIISPPFNGTWIKILVNGRIGWGNCNVMEVLQ